MGVQKTYGYATSKGVAGGIYDMFHYPVDSRFNEEATGKLHFGVGVVTGKVPGSSVALPTSASTADNFEGVVINGFDRQQDLEGKLYVLNNQNVGVMRRGRVWVRLATGAKGSTKWADKTEDEILADITGMLKQVARTTKKVEKPDTLALPSEAYIEIQNRRIESTATTVLKYVQDNIKDIARIVSCPELDPDSVDTNPYAAESDGKGVALLFKNDPRKFTIENPLSFMQYPVQPEGLEMVVPCEARTAGAIIYYPMSMLIATGIC